MLRPAFKLVPFPVLLGFLTSIGLSMFASALGNVVPDPATNSTTGGFKSLTDPTSWENLGAPGAPRRYKYIVFFCIYEYSFMVFQKLTSDDVWKLTETI